MAADTPAGWLARHPGRLVLAFALAQLAGWTLVPALVLPNLPIDVIEGLAWGREWQLGYAKHPPLAAWLLQATTWLAGPRDWPVYLLSQTAVVATFALVWALSRELVGGPGAALSVLALAGVYYFSIPTPEFNPNVLQMPIWAAIALAFHRALTRPGLGWWLALGGLAALGLHAKYFTAVLLAVLALFLLLEPTARRRLAGPGPYLALAVLAVLAVPHLRWLAEQEFRPFLYAGARGGAGGAGLDRLLFPLRFLVTQLADHGGLVLLALLAWWGTRRRAEAPALRLEAPEDALARRFVAAVALGPLALSLAISAAFGLRFQSMWGAPMFAFSGLFCVAVLRPALTPCSLRRLGLAWAVLFLGGLAFLAGAKTLGPYLRGEASKQHYPGPATATYFTEAWRQRFERPLAVVVGDAWIGGNVAFYSPDRPSLFIEGDPRRSFWIAPERLAASGALLVWRADRDGTMPPARLVGALAAERLEPQPPVAFPWRTGADVAPVSLGWALLPPAR